MPGTISEGQIKRWKKYVDSSKQVPGTISEGQIKRWKKYVDSSKQVGK